MGQEAHTMVLPVSMKLAPPPPAKASKPAKDKAAVKTATPKKAATAKPKAKKPAK